MDQARRHLGVRGGAVRDADGPAGVPGEDVTETIVAVISREPDFAALPASVPGRVGQVLRVCLRKDPKDRAQAIGDVRLALAGAFETAASPAISTAAGRGTRAPPLAGRRGRGGRGAPMASGRAGPRARSRALPAPPEMRVEIATPATEAPLDFAAVAGRPRPRLCRVGRRAVAAVGASARSGRGPPAGRHRGRARAVLVARQPRGRLLRQRDAPAPRPRRARHRGWPPRRGSPSRAVGTRRARSCSRRGPLGPLGARRGRRGHAGGGDAARCTPAERPSRPAVPPAMAGSFCSTPAARLQAAGISPGGARRHLPRRG